MLPTVDLQNTKKMNDDFMKFLASEASVILEIFE